MKLLFLSLLSIFSLNLLATDISGIINQYSKVTAAGNCDNAIVVQTPENFEKNEEVILIQMQGATIVEDDNASFGSLQDLNGTGLYEKAEITLISNDTIYFRNNISNTYNFSKKLQIVSYPRYSDVTITSTLTCKAWDGETGGLLAFQVSGDVTINAPIDVSGKGFRGGSNNEISGNGCTWLFASSAFFYPNTSWEGASKGEGIAEYITGKEFGKGAQANGGGGGNDHNSGGAGGGNYGAGGSGGDNDDPSTFACKSYDPGIGGYTVPNSANYAFMGGGGGAGHGNNGLSSAGANGGGIIIISASGFQGTDQQILAKGNSASITSGGDGAGAGGAGGTVVLQVTTMGTNLTVDISGGNGGNVDDEFYNRCHGPGGGGAGGVIKSVNGLGTVTINKNGGSAGIVTNSTAACNGTVNGAAAGASGGQVLDFLFPAGTTPSNCIITNASNISKSVIKLFPNPSGNFFNIQALDDYSKVEIFDNTGRLVTEFNGTQTQFGSELSRGVYLVKVYSENYIQSIRIVKK